MYLLDLLNQNIKKKKKNYGKIVSIGKTKRAIFIANIATNLLKDYDFANIGSIDILKCRLK